MKKFFLILIFSFLFLPKVFAENLILKPSLTPMIYENSYKNNFFVNNQTSESTKKQELQNDINNFTNDSCVKNPEIRVFMYHYIRHA